MGKITKTITVAEYVAKHNKSCIDQINRHDVYAMIKEGKLTASKNERGHWLIRVEEPSVEYTPSKFVEEYNKRHKKDPITVEKVRKLAAEGVIEANKVGRKWIILQSPRKKIKL